MDPSYRDLRLPLRQRVPVTVVVVPHVVMVQKRRALTLPRLAQSPLVPVGHHLRPVRVQRRYQQDDRLIQDPQHRSVCARCQTVRDPYRSLERSHLRRVDRRRDQDHYSTLGKQILCLQLRVHQPRIRQSPLDLLVAIQAGQIVRTRYCQHHEGAPQCRHPQRIQQHSIAALRQRLRVARDLVPVRQSPIHPQLEPQHRIGARNRRIDLGLGERPSRKRESHQSERESDPHLLPFHLVLELAPWRLPVSRCGL